MTLPRWADPANDANGNPLPPAPDLTDAEQLRGLRLVKLGKTDRPKRKKDWLPKKQVVNLSLRDDIEGASASWGINVRLQEGGA